MANEISSSTPATVDSATPTPATPATPAPPTEIQGSTVPPGAPAATTTALPSGISRSTQDLFRSGDVSISRETTTAPGGPFAGTPTNQMQYGDMVVINTGAGDDRVNVAQRKDGTLDVDVNGQKYHITLAPGQELGVRSGDGNDVVRAAANVSVNMDVYGGAGNDTITTGKGRDRVDGGAGNDIINTGAGRDDVFGGAGNDTIDAGSGHDVVYGGDGNDILRGGKGRDYIEGGAGNDVMEGGTGNDVLSGGLGDDTLRGDNGNDRVYTGAGKDTVDNKSGNDVVYGQTADDTMTAAKGAKNTVTNVDMTTTLGSSITVTGSAEFQQRINADIEMLRSSPDGRQMLSQLDATGKSLTISELPNIRNGGATPAGGGNFLQTVTAPDGTTSVVPGTGTNSSIAFNPSNHDDRFPNSVVVLYHEMSHAYNHMTGTRQQGTNTGAGIDNGTNNREMQAVGLNNSGLSFNFPGGTGATTTNPAALTENGLRGEMGLPLRPSYNFTTTGPSAWTGGLGSPDSATPAKTGDASLDRMINAAQSGNREALNAAQTDLRNSPAGQQFQQDGAAAAERTAPKQPTAAAPQPEPEAASAGGQRR
ncbi:MAG: hypothetical protein IT473_10275 [Lysobacter sp.]|nr:hypothetical protein [Lysobacter sp.]